MRLILISLVFLLTSCAMTGHYNLNEGIASFKQQNYRHAFLRLKPEAERGQPDAQYAVGYMYYYGQGVTENKKQALYWIQQAARAGQKDAIKAMGLLQRP